MSAKSPLIRSYCYLHTSLSLGCSSNIAQRNWNMPLSRGSFLTFCCIRSTKVAKIFYETNFPSINDPFSVITPWISSWLNTKSLGYTKLTLASNLKYSSKNIWDCGS